jgi:hypothetical protein
MSDTLIQLKRALSSNWTIDNPILLEGEQGLELDTNRMKIGDGASRWNSLPYYSKQFDNIYINGNTISSENTNGDIFLKPNGTGKVYVNNEEILTNLSTIFLSRYARKDQNNIFPSSYSNTFAGVLDITGTFRIGSTTVDTTATELNYLHNITPGTATINKPLFVDNSFNLSGVRNLSLIGSLTSVGEIRSSGSFYSNNKKIATEEYVDNQRKGFDIKQSVRVATIADINLTGLQTIDGVSLVTGNRILVKNQILAYENGIYDVKTTAWSRSSDANSNDSVTTGLFVFVSEGTVNLDTGWLLTTNDTVSLGVTDLSFSLFSSASQLTAGNGLIRTDNTFSARGTSGRIVVASYGIDLALISGLISGTYSKVTVDYYGRVTAGSNPSTLAGYGITDATPYSLSLAQLSNAGLGEPGTVLAFIGSAPSWEIIDGGSP